MTTYIATFYRPNGKVCKRTIEAPDYNNAEEQAQQMGAAMPLQVRAKARVKVMEEIGKHCLHEIKGLKEGDEVEGLYTPPKQSLRLHMARRGRDAVDRMQRRDNPLTTQRIWNRHSTSSASRKRATPTP